MPPAAVPRSWMAMLILGAIVLAAVSGIQETAGQFKTAHFIMRFTAGSLAAGIVWVDSIKWKRPFPIFSLWLVMMLWPIALPVCCMRTRGLKGLFKSAGFLVLLWVIWLGSAWGGWWLLERQAYRAHAAGEFARAIRLYDRMLETDPAYEWALENRALALEALNNK